MTGVTVITDLHLRKDNTRTEPKLLDTQDKLLKSISDICVQKSEQYDRHIVVFLGDICDRNLTGLIFTKVCYWFGELARHSEVYAVTGNHELTYKSMYNLYWHLGYGEAFVKSPKLETVNEVIKVVSSLNVEGTQLIFNHCKQTINFTDSQEIENVVILTHNAIIMPELEQLLTEEEDQDPKSNYVHYTGFKDYLPPTDKLRYILSGHVHSLYGQYRIQERMNSVDYDFVMYYLSTLGRPKSNEFDDRNTRDLPTLEIAGSSLSLVHNYITLEGREVLDDTAIEEMHEKYENSKHIKRLKKQTYSKDDVLGTLAKMYEMNMSKNLIFQNALAEMPDEDIERSYAKIKEINLYE